MKELQSANIFFNNFENKNTRPIRVTVEGLHHDTPIINIIISLKDSGFKPLSVAHNLKRIVEYPGKNKADTFPNFSATPEQMAKTNDPEPINDPNYVAKTAVNDTAQPTSVSSGAPTDSSGSGAEAEVNQGKSREGSSSQTAPPPLLSNIHP